MTISTQSHKVVYQANGSTTVWSFDFPGGPDPNILVFVIDPDGIQTNVSLISQINLNPNIDPNPTSSGGYVVYPLSGPPLAIGNQLLIMRLVPIIQPTSLSNQSTFYPEVVEKALDYIVEEIQQLAGFIENALLLPGNETGPLFLPGCPERAGKFLGFDANCKPIAVGVIPLATQNAIRVPTNESIPALPGALSRPGQFISFDGSGNPILVSTLPPNVPPLFGASVTITANHTITNSEKGFLLKLSGNTFFTVSLGAATAYDVNFSIAIVNTDVYNGPGTGRAKRITLNGVLLPGGLLWPGQWVYIFRDGANWIVNPPDVRWKPGVPVTFYVDPVAGFDDGSSDGLGPGSGAMVTVNFAVQVAYARVDYGGFGGTINAATIQLAAGTYTEIIMINSTVVGGKSITIQGAAGAAAPNPYVFQVPGGNTGITVDRSANVNVKGFVFYSTGDNATGLVVAHGSTVFVDNCIFSNFPGAAAYHMRAADSSTLVVNNIQIVGGVAFPMVAWRQATIKLTGNLTVGGGLNFNTFAAAYYNSAIVGGAGLIGEVAPFILSGGVGCTGNRYQVQYNSVGNLGPGGMQILPGDAPGITGGTAPAQGTDSSAVY